MKNLLNLRWLHGSPNQTGETLTRENRLGIGTRLNPMRTLCITLFLLTLGTGQMWAWDLQNFNNPYIYFLNSQGWNKAAVIYGRGHDSGSYTKVANMGLVTNTNLYYVYINDYWGDKGFNQIAVMEAEKSGSSWGDASQRIEDRWKDVTNKTGIKWDFDMSDDYSTYYITSTGSDNIDMTRKSTSATGWTSIPKCTTTLEVQTRNSTGSYSSISSSAPATLTIGGTYLSGNGSSTTAYDANSWPTASTFNSVISGLAKVKYASKDDRYTFDGWYVSDSQVGTSTEYTFYQTSNTTVVAKFTRVKYTVTFDQQSGSGGSSSVTATYNSAMPSATMPTRSCYTFAGYYTETSGSGTKYYNANGSSAKTCDLTGDITLYAKWTQSVTLDANTSHGGSGSDGSATATWNGASLSSILHPSGATGYTCTGYFTAATDGTKVLNANGTYAGSDITGYITGGKWSRTEATTLYAQWDNHYTITLDDDDASIHGTTSTTATYGEAMPAITVPSKTGYIFDGYYTNTSDEDTKYYNANGTSAKNWNITSDTELHAKWTGIRYQVVFDANEGSGTMTNKAMNYGVADNLTDNAYTRTGYYFLGWNTNADGSGTAFYNGKSVQDLTSVNGGIVKLYAQWAKTYTLYFLNMGVSGWDNGANTASTTRYAFAFISYDGHEMYPLGTYSAGTSQGTRMTASSSIALPNVGTSPTTWCWSIDGVPEGATIIFSDNTDNHKTGDLSGWTSSKPYYCNGNGTWYALDGDNSISQVTNMSVHIGAGDFGDSWKYYGIDKHGDGQYAIIWLNKNQTYQFKFSNWYQGGESGSDFGYSIIDGGNTKADYGGEPRTLSGTNNVNVNTTTHASGEYKFVLTGWAGDKPQTRVYVPRGVNLTSTSPTQAPAGESVTVSLQADAWTNLSSGTDMDNPTYTFQFSTDNSNWTDIAVVSPESNKMQATTDYTFTARSGYFRVKLVNDNGLASYSDATSFTAYSTKSFYVYNPYNNASDKWQTLHLYTWNNAGSKPTYNGSFPGGDASSCINGNAILSKGGDWYYITIDERADKFQLVGDADYNTHKTVDCSVSNYIQDAKYMIYTEDDKNKVVEYQAKGASDYRLKYTGSGGTRYSNIYNTILDGTTVISSMWMNANDATASLAIEQGTGSDTWAVRKTYSNDGKDGFDGLVDSDHRDHGYVFQMNINFNSGAPASSTINNVAVYNGPFYVRTDGLDGGWNVYENAKHQMHYSEHSLNGSPAYNYYLCKWINEAGTNVKFTVANDYNKELVASLEGDVNSTDPLYNRQTVPTPTNVRFSWNSQTNTLTRAYLSGATSASSRFLVMVEKASDAGYTTGKIYNENGDDLTDGKGKVSGLNEHELLFADNGNWVYELIMRANPGAQADVTAKYNEKEQKFIDNMTLIADGGATKYTYRITYDFKTNILTNAWVPYGQVNEDIDLKSNVMLIRNGQGAAQELTFGAKGGGHYSITNAKKLISVMQFDYDNMVGRMSTWNSQAYQYCMYYISFPFDVNVSDIFGIGTYGTDWKLQYYDGAERASKGFFRGDGTTTFWKDVPANGKLDKYVGYSLLLNRIKFNDGSSDIWENKGTGSSVYLYFPSTADAGTLQHDDYVLNVPDHECTLPQSWTDESGTHYHSVTDSHWNMIGVPILANSTVDGGLQSILGSSGDFRYLYAWDYGDNSLSVADAKTSFTFQAMKAYMVQYYGSITFTGAGIQTPSSVAARRTAETRNLNIELQVLNADEQEINHTYVKMQEGADADFRLNEDLCMVTNNRAVNIYTYAGSYDVAANVLPLETTTVPVGVMVKTAGTYTFSMPSHFDGTVTLVDTYAQTSTNLGIEDYTVNLEEGTFNSRFLLELNIHQAPTAIDGVSDGTLKDGKAHKFLQNGVMYILQNGVMYDAQGKRVK